MGLNGQWDRRGQRGAFDAWVTSTGGLSSSATSVSAAQSALVPPDTQRAEEGKGGLGGIHIATAGAAAVLTGRSPATIALAATIFGTGDLREVHGGHNRWKRLRGHAARGSSTSGS